MPLIGARSAFLGPLLVACGSLAACACDDEVLSELRSPDGKYVASVMERNCGATTDYVSHVTVRPSDSMMRQGDDVLVVEYRQDIRLAWEGVDHLVVEFRSCPGDMQPLKIVSETRRWGDRVEIERRDGGFLSGDDPRCRKDG